MTQETNVDAALLRALTDAVAAGAAPGGVAEAVGPAGAGAAVAGWLATTGDDGAPLPEPERTPVTADVAYDLASLTKVFSAITLLALCDAGALAVAAPLGEWLPAYREPAKAGVTLAHLLTHTAGLRPSWLGWADARPRPRADVLAEIVALPLDRPPGEAMAYSCVGYVTAMAAAEAATGRGWADLVEAHALRPLGCGARFRPLGTPADARIAPTEFEPQLGRGMIRGIVHDETAWALGGVSANAGLFGSVADVMALARALAAGLPDVLSPESFALLWEDQLPRLLPGVDTGAYTWRQSMGLRIGQASFLGPRGTELRGHTGFTGTSLAVDDRGGVAVLLTNRVHPTRTGPDLGPARVAVCEAAGLGGNRS